MISPVRATAVVGLGSVLSLAASVVVAKVLAILIGPDGVGLLGVMQSLVGIAGMLVGFGVATGLVRGLASAIAQGDVEEVGGLRQAGSLIVLGTGSVGLILLVLGREWVASTILGDSGRAGDVLFIAPAVVLSALAGIELAIINGYHRIGALTLGGLLGALGASTAMMGFVAVAGEDGIAPAILAGAAASLVISFAVRARIIGMSSRLSDPGRLAAVARSLIRFGGPYTASAIVGTGAQLLVPVIVLNQLGQAEAGHYRAASTIAVGYLAFLLTSFAQDYYPRIAAAQPEELVALIEKRMRLVMALAVPIILATLALAPLAIRLLYSDDFLPATQVLEWQLVGDLLKLPAWALSFVILARGSSGRFFAVELLGGAVLVGATIVGTEMLGLAGAGVAYFVSYAVYCVAVWLVVRRWAATTPGRLQLSILVLVVFTLALVVLPASLVVLRSIVLLGLAGVMAALAWPRLWRLHRMGEL